MSYLDLKEKNIKKLNYYLSNLTSIKLEEMTKVFERHKSDSKYHNSESINTLPFHKKISLTNDRNEI